MNTSIAKRCFLGHAVGDALGVPLEFRTGLVDEDFELVLEKKRLQASDDTQMALFLAEALLKTRRGTPDFKKAYVRWYYTQTHAFRSSPDLTGLLTFEELYKIVAPGITCMRSSKCLTEGVPVMNDSKGNGTVMRCLPIALYALKNDLLDDWVLAVAEEDALTTHKHSLAAVSSKMLSLLYLYLLKGYRLKDAYVRISAHQFIPNWLVEKMTLVLDKNQYLQCKVSMGGWVAEEAFILAVGAALHSEGDFLTGIKNAVLFSGDSDTVGAITGSILASSGILPPSELVGKLDIIEPINMISRHFNI